MPGMQSREALNSYSAYSAFFRHTSACGKCGDNLCPTGRELRAAADYTTGDLPRGRKP